MDRPNSGPLADAQNLRCCGKAPAAYKGGRVHKHGRQRYCKLCKKSYNYDTGQPRENFDWYVVDGEHRAKHTAAKEQGRP